MEFKIKKYEAPEKLAAKQTLSLSEVKLLNHTYTLTIAHRATVLTDSLYTPYVGEGAFFMALKRAQEQGKISPLYSYGIFDQDKKPLVSIAGNGCRAWDLTLIRKSCEPRLLFFVQLLLRKMPKKKLFSYTLQEFLAVSHAYMEQIETGYSKLDQKKLALEFKNPFLKKLFPRLYRLYLSKQTIHRGRMIDKSKLREKFVI